MKNLKMGLLIISIVIAASFNSMHAEKKVCDLQQHECSFSFAAELNDNCCIEITVTNLISYEQAEEGHKDHPFSIYLNGSESPAYPTVGDPTDGEWNYGDSLATLTYCPPLCREFTLLVEVKCDDCGNTTSHSFPFDMTECFDFDCDCDTGLYEMFAEAAPIAELQPKLAGDPPDCCRYRINFDNLSNFISEATYCFDYISIDLGNTPSPAVLDLPAFIDQYVKEGHTAYKSYCTNDRDTKITIGFTNDPTGTVNSNCEWELDAPCFRGMPLEDTNPCTPDCILDPWQTEEGNSFTVTLLNGTVVNITYEFAFRNACGEYQDIQILSYTVTTASGTVTSSSELYALIIEHIIEKQGATTGFLPNTDNMANNEERCDTTWRVMAGSCWAYMDVSIIADLELGEAILLSSPGYEELPTSTIPGTIADHIINFGSDAMGTGFNETRCESDCCLQRIKVCVEMINDEPVWSKTLLDLPDEQIDCDELTLEYSGYDLPCEPRCSWLVSMGYYWGNNKIIINEPKPQAITTKLSYNQIEITSNAYKQGTMDVKIYDNIGNLLITKNKVLGTGQQRMLINTTELRTGTYHYTITINGKIMKSNKFVIVK